MKKSIKIKSDASNASDYFYALDGIRGILALTIALYHTSWASNIAGFQLLENGPIVVDIFFVLSGFIMYQLYNGTINNMSDGLSYMKKRLARIYPLHFVTLILMLIYSVLLYAVHRFGISDLQPGQIMPLAPGSESSLKAFIANLTLTNSMGVLDTLSFNTPAWSISVEFFAYIIFALMMIYFRPYKTWHFGLIGGAISLNYAILSTLKPNLDFHYDLGIFRCLGGFYTGVLVSWSLGKFKGKAASLYATFIELLAMLIFIGFFLFASGRLQFLLAPIAFILVFVFARGQGAISSVLASKPFAYLGKISYSIYMMHMFVCIVFGHVAIKVMPRLLGETWNEGNFVGDILILIYVIAVLITAHFSYCWIEVKGRAAIMKKLR